MIFADMSLLELVDFIATFIFALSGAVVAVRYRLDLFGVLVLAFLAGNAGGITRDIIIAAQPPAAIADWRYVAICSLAGILTFTRHHWVIKLEKPVLILDALGLGLFAVSGASKALEYGVPPVGAVLMGLLTGVGGGMMRDMLTARIPAVLQADLYASAALTAGIVMVMGESWQLPSNLSAFIGASLCFFLRMMAIYRGWRLPLSKHTSAQR